MKLQADRFKQLVRESGVTVEQLAAALPTQNGRAKQRRLAEKRVRNWMEGKDHPRATAADIHALADALGVPVASIAKYTSVYRWARSSHQKAGLVADLIRGRDYLTAKQQLELSPKRAAEMVEKALDAAFADARENGVDEHDLGSLVVSEARVDRGLYIKRFQPKDRGRAHPINKKTCHITVSVEQEAL